MLVPINGLAQNTGSDGRAAATAAIQRFPTLWRNVSMEVLEGTDQAPPGTRDDRKPTPTAVVTERKYSLVAHGLDVRIDRYGQGLMAPNRRYPQGLALTNRSTEWFVGGKRYVSYGFTNAPPGATDQGAFSTHRGTLPTPLQFSYQRYDRWLSDYLDEFDWGTLREVSNPNFGSVLAIDRKGGFGLETLELWPKGGYMIVSVTFHGQGRAYQYNTIEAQQVQGIWFPKRLEELHFSSDDISRSPEQKILYEVDNLRFDQSLASDLFVPTWAENSVVKDGDATIYYTVHRGKLIFEPSLNPGKSPIKPILFVGAFGSLAGILGNWLVKKRRAAKELTGTAAFPKP